MGFVELFLIGVGLSMDAFAVAVCKGLNMKRVNVRYALIIALFFGGFQALMPFLGFTLGRQFESYIVSYDHWVAFALLFIIGGKMIKESFDADEDGACGEPKLDLKELFTLAVATSIDALAVGISFAFLNVEIIPAVALIGATTFLLSLGGVCVGCVFGAKYKNAAERLGGVILVLIGLKILLEHLGVF